MEKFCFWDSFEFIGDGVRLPLQKSSSGEVTESTFSFCSIPCAIAFLNDTTMFPPAKKNVIRGYLSENYIDAVTSPLSGTFVAPPRSDLVRYGGTKTIDEFRFGLRAPCHAYDMPIDTTRELENLAIDL